MTWQQQTRYRMMEETILYMAGREDRPGWIEVERPRIANDVIRIMQDEQLLEIYAPLLGVEISR